MEALLKKLNTIPESAELAARVEDGGCPVAVSGLAAVHRAQIGAAVAQATGRPAVFVCGDEREAHALAGDLTALMGQQPVLLLAREWNFRPNAIASRGWEQNRLAALYALADQWHSCAWVRWGEAVHSSPCGRSPGRGCMCRCRHP